MPLKIKKEAKKDEKAEPKSVREALQDAYEKYPKKKE